MPENLPTILPFLVLFLVVAVLAIGLWLGRRWETTRQQRRQAIAEDGEYRAERLLEKAGYRILDRQVTGSWWISIDGQETEVWVRADFLVEKKGKRLVAEVKTGAVAPDPTYPHTRRQLLEYRLVFGGDMVILVDAEANSLHEIRFPEISDA